MHGREREVFADAGDLGLGTCNVFIAVEQASDIEFCGVIVDALARHTRPDQVVLDLVKLPNHAAIAANGEGLCW